MPKPSCDMIYKLSSLFQIDKKMADWIKIFNLKRNNLPLRQLDDFSEEEKRTIVEKNTVKKIRPRHLGKQYHTSQDVIESFIKSAGFNFTTQISQKQERIQQEQEETKIKQMVKVQKLNSCQKRLQELSGGEKMANIKENTEQLKGPKQLKRRKGDWFCQTKACNGYLNFRSRPNCQFCNMPKPKVNPNHLDELLNHKRQSYKKYRNISLEDKFDNRTSKGQ